MKNELIDAFEKVDHLGGHEILVMDNLAKAYPEKFNPDGGMDWEWFEKEIRPHRFIYLRKDKGSISFTMQSGPVKEVGANGCQVDSLIDAAKWMLVACNGSLPCRETSIAITKLEEALMWLQSRTRDREARGVEGTWKE